MMRHFIFSRCSTSLFPPRWRRSSVIMKNNAVIKNTMLDIFSILEYFLPKCRHCVWALLTTGWKKAGKWVFANYWNHATPGAPDFEHKAQDKAPVSNKHCKVTSFYASNTYISLWYCFRNSLIVKKRGLLGFLGEISWAKLWCIFTHFKSQCMYVWYNVCVNMVVIQVQCKWFQCNMSLTVTGF